MSALRARHEAREQMIFRRRQRQRHREMIAITEFEDQVVQPDRERLIEEGVICFACGYPLRGGWCWRCLEAGISPSRSET